jgi:hypothetical protein
MTNDWSTNVCAMYSVATVNDRPPWKLLWDPGKILGQFDQKIVEI